MTKALVTTASHHLQSHTYWALVGNAGCGSRCACRLPAGGADGSDATSTSTRRRPWECRRGAAACSGRPTATRAHRSCRTHHETLSSRCRRWETFVQASGRQMPCRSSVGFSPACCQDVLLMRVAVNTANAHWVASGKWQIKELWLHSVGPQDRNIISDETLLLCVARTNLVRKKNKTICSILDSKAQSDRTNVLNFLIKEMTHALLMKVGLQGPILRSHPLSLQSSPPTEDDREKEEDVTD